MALATYKDLCIDAVYPRRLGVFYAAALGLAMDTDDDEADAMLTGPTPRHRRLRRAEREREERVFAAPEPIEPVERSDHKVFLNPVPEPKTVKNRVHLDVHTGNVDDLVALGATVVNHTDFTWTVMTDPEGQEFCAFVRERPPAEKLYAIVVDCADPAAIATWWGTVLGVEARTEEGEGYYWLEKLPGVPFDGFSFVPVPEPKTVKNRVHWDVYGERDALVDAGATMVLPQGDDREWDVLADPDGNEFCVFAETGA